MSHSLISSTAVAVAALPNSHKINAVPTVSYHKIVASHQPLVHSRRGTTLGLGGLVLGFIQVGCDDRHANAAGRRPPPPPPEEKKDPSINGVTAKVLASKKRKEAMKESIARLKDKGKLITEPSQ
ncbi:Zinc transporter like [Heracleum sosnowskyi]|uniref:Zinc transporter like n=1 Tax=Heracleum sosnowskyi TaxID=360622 RepID=A0AAD8LZN4_9APIA|nr:Zinc transporter like [Heracleum sosnowskyi]